MKKLLTVIASLLIVWTASARHVSPNEAAVVANHFMNGISTPAQGVHKAPAKPMVLKAAAQDTAAQYYVYENANGEGWVMVAANDAVRPVLAYSPTGRFCTDNQPANVRAWLNKYNRFIRVIEQDAVEAGEETSAEWQMLRIGKPQAKGDAVVGPLIQTTWDQDSPYYDQCPGYGQGKAYVGCVATAMAQVMNYWQWPKQGIGSHSYQPLDPNTGQESKRYGTQTVDFSATTYDWDNMLNSYGYNATTAQETAVATLMYHCGVAVEMMYGNYADGGSGAYTVNYGFWDINEIPCAQNALYHFFGYKQSISYMRDGYSEGGVVYYEKWTDDAWTEMVRTELDALRPIMYAGASSEGGHSFICDGYDDAGYFHFNWGWSGQNDGYYLLSRLTPGSGGAGGGSYDFSESQDVIIGIEPMRNGHPVVINAAGGKVIPSSTTAENDQEWTAKLMPADATYDLASLSIRIGNRTLVKDTDFTLSEDQRQLTVMATAISGEETSEMTISVVWEKKRNNYTVTGTHCASVPAGMVDINTPLQLIIEPDEGYVLSEAACWEVKTGNIKLTYGSHYTYDAATSTLTIEQLKGDVTIRAWGSRFITWIADGEEADETLAVNDILTLPSATPASCDPEMQFVGWTATADYQSESSAPQMVKNGNTATATTYYAVYAMQSEQADTDTIAVVFKTSYGDSSRQPSDISSLVESTTGGIASYSGNNVYQGKHGIKLGTRNASGDLTITLQRPVMTQQIIVEAIQFTNTSGTADTGKIKVEVNNNTAFGMSRTAPDALEELLYTVSEPIEVNSITVSTTSKRAYVRSVTVLGEGDRYSHYTTQLDCGSEGIESATAKLPAALKTIRNGQLVIIRGEAVYTPTGVRIE